MRRACARNELISALVGDTDAKKAGELIDRAFGGLPAKNDRKPVAEITPKGLGKTIVMVTHDPMAAGRARRMVHLEKGVLVSDAEYQAELQAALHSTVHAPR